MPRPLDPLAVLFAESLVCGFAFLPPVALLMLAAPVVTFLLLLRVALPAAVPFTVDSFVFSFDLLGDGFFAFALAVLLAEDLRDVDLLLVVFRAAVFDLDEGLALSLLDSSEESFVDLLFLAVPFIDFAFAPPLVLLAG